MKRLQAEGTTDLFDAVEILTPKQSVVENELGMVTQKRFNLVGNGGSGSHFKDELGQCVTEVLVPIKG